MKLIAFACLIILTSCSSMLDESHFDVDARLKPFVDKFYAEVSEKGIYVNNDNLIIRFNDVLKKDGVIGITWYESTRIIELDYSVRDRIETDPLFVETVLYHEFGHALFNREHCFDCYSLMNPNKYILEYRTDSASRKKLINELIH